MTFYESMEPTQEVIDLGLDESGRQVLGFNVNVVKAYSQTFRQEVTGLLVASGVGTFVGPGANIFRGALAKLPTDGGPYLHLRETGGTAPRKTHNEVNPPANQRPTMQITARSTSYTAADVMIQAAYLTVNIRNRNLAP